MGNIRPFKRRIERYKGVASAKVRRWGDRHNKDIAERRTLAEAARHADRIGRISQQPTVTQRVWARVKRLINRQPVDRRMK